MRILLYDYRIFLEEFFLPGESQIIDRMMQKFAYHYCDQNKDVFSCAGKLHKKNYKKKLII